MIHILVVDDDKSIQKLYGHFLKSTNYISVFADNGKDALELLKEEPGKFSTVILDWEMPEMNGIEVLKKLKSSKEFKTLPAIMASGRDQEEDITLGLQEGAYYYLVKPVSMDQFLAIVKTAVTDYENFRSLKQELDETIDAFNNLVRGGFKIRTIDDASILAVLLAKTTPRPSKVIIGLMELLINAIEHGNLGISYEEKSELNKNWSLHKETSRRMSLKENKNKCVYIEFTRKDNELLFHIKDEGEGFEWEKYLNFSPERAFDTHGRGIALASSLSFENVKYIGNGNEVIASVSLE